MSIAVNIKARKLAEQAVERLVDGYEPAANQESLRQRFWEVIARYAANEAGFELSKPSKEPLSYEEALAFEQSEIPFGVHRGKRMGDIPPSYWLAVFQSDFDIAMRAYLSSKRFRDLQEQGV